MVSFTPCFFSAPHLEAFLSLAKYLLYLLARKVFTYLRVKRTSIDWAGRDIDIMLKNWTFVWWLNAERGWTFSYVAVSAWVSRNKVRIVEAGWPLYSGSFRIKVSSAASVDVALAGRVVVVSAASSGTSLHCRRRHLAIVFLMKISHFLCFDGLINWWVVKRHSC